VHSNLAKDCFQNYSVTRFVCQCSSWWMKFFFVISKLSPEMFTAREVCKFKFKTVFAPEVSEWVEFNAPLDTIQVISEAEFCTRKVCFWYANTIAVWRSIVHWLRVTGFAPQHIPGIWATYKMQNLTNFRRTDFLETFKVFRECNFWLTCKKFHKS